MTATTNQTGELLSELLDTYALWFTQYVGKPLAVTATGGGVSLLSIPLVMGASKVFNAGIVPYGFTANAIFAGIPENAPDVKAVSKEMALMYCTASEFRAREECQHVVVTAALLTNRAPRRPRYEAYVMLSGDVRRRAYRLSFAAPTAEQYAEWERNGELPVRRLAQDILITLFILQTLAYKSIDLSTSIANNYVDDFQAEVL